LALGSLGSESKTIDTVLLSSVSEERAGTRNDTSKRIRRSERIVLECDA
jgi:hypothetical protein